MTTLSADEILAADDKSVQQVEVPDWGGDVYIRIMTGRERDELAIQNLTGTNLRNARARFVCVILCDESGNRLFKDAQAGALGEKSSAVLDDLFDRGMTLNRIRDVDVEELAGNSSGDQSADSGSSSHVPSLAVVSEKPKSA